MVTGIEVFVKRTTKASGVPLFVEDRRTIERLYAVLRAANKEGEK